MLDVLENLRLGVGEGRAGIQLKRPDSVCISCTTSIYIGRARGA